LQTAKLSQGVAKRELEMRVPDAPRSVEIPTHDLALVEQVVEGSDSLLDRGGEVRAVGEDDVGVVELEPCERAKDAFNHVLPAEPDRVDRLDRAAPEDLCAHNQVLAAPDPFLDAGMRTETARRNESRPRVSPYASFKHPLSHSINCQGAEARGEPAGEAGGGADGRSARARQREREREEIIGKRGKRESKTWERRVMQKRGKPGE